MPYGMVPFFADGPRGGGEAMPKLVAPGQPYAGRREDAAVINTTIDRDAAAVLRRYCPEGRKGMGKFLARLLYEHDAREQERVRLREHIREVIGEGKGR
jgi:hypothetical protein